MHLFITGISGLLGLNTALQLRERFQTSGCYHSHRVALDGVRCLEVDVRSEGALEEALRDSSPDVILNAVGLTNVEACEANPELAYELNTTAARDIARAATSLGAKLVHVSTDHLFDGADSRMTEDHSVSPLNSYAKSKLDAEGEVLNECPDALVLRTNFFGWGTPIRASLSDWILSALKAQTELRMFSDVFFSPIVINDLVDLIIALVEKNASGVFHVAGADRLSKHAFAVKLAEVFGYSDQGIRSVSLDSVPELTQRPRDMSLNCAKAEAFLGMRMPSVVESIRRLLRLREHSWDKRLYEAFATGSTPGEQ